MILNLDKKKLNELLMDFYILTKTKIVLFDDKFNKIIAYPDIECDFCRLIKSNQEAKKECMKSDRHACNTCLSTGKLYMYKCHAGLIEVAAPIKVNDIIIGFIMFGQIIDSLNIDDVKREVLKNCEKYKIDDELLIETFNKLVSKTPQEIKATSKIMESCACFLWIYELIKVGGEQLFLKIDEYINTHISQDLCADLLCEKFKISRSRLYDLSKNYFGMGIAEYIRKKRIKTASKLLSEKNYKVNEIAESVGIHDYNYFSKIFKAETGYTPREYMKKSSCSESLHDLT